MKNGLHAVYYVITTAIILALLVAALCGSVALAVRCVRYLITVV